MLIVFLDKEFANKNPTLVVNPKGWTEVQSVKQQYITSGVLSMTNR